MYISFHLPLPSFPCSLQAAALIQAAGRLFGQRNCGSKRSKLQERSMIQLLYHREAVGGPERRLWPVAMICLQEIIEHLFSPAITKFPMFSASSCTDTGSRPVVWPKKLRIQKIQTSRKIYDTTSISTPHLLPRKDKRLARTCQAELLRI